MFHLLLKKLRFWYLLAQNAPQNPTGLSSAEQNLTADLKANLALISQVFGTSTDVVIRQFTIGTKKEIEAAIIYVDGMADNSLINESILRPLMVDVKKAERYDLRPGNALEVIQTDILTVGEVKRGKAVNDVVDGALSGDVALLIDGSQEALVISARGWETRGVQEPQTEVVVRGPREGFTETLRTNTALLRRKIRNPKLTFDTMRLGKQTKTDVCIVYLKGITNDRLVEEIKRRLKRIETDAILESGYIEQFIEDAPFSPFSTIANTEKPDVAAAKILEGRAAILVDGTPVALTVLMLFVEGFQSSEDYYSRPYFASMVRWFRYIAFTLSVLSPAAYVALTTYHQEIIPTPLLITMAAAREGTPFPAMVEAIGNGIVFEILREAGVRMPRAVGQAVSIVGALVIGEAAVSAGLIGAPMVIVVAITAIASFVVPPQADVGGILRLFFTILAGALGGFGMIIGLLGVLVHMASLRSFGAPYLSPIAPLSPGDLKDVVVRAPLWMMFTQPRAIGWQDPERQEFRLLPQPPPDGKRAPRP